MWRAFADRTAPDGIRLDAEGAVWIDTGRGAFACMLGGDDRGALYV